MQKKKIKLLIIEDDAELIELLHNYFGPRGYEISGFTDPMIPLDILEKQSNSHAYEVALVDLNLPKMSGLDFIKKMKVVCPDMPILLMTSDNSIETAMEAVEAGAYDYVVKPLHFPQLNLSLQRAVRLKTIQDENKTLRSFADPKNVLEKFVFKSQKMINILDVAKRVADSSATVLIHGESGTGKEVIARAISQLGKYKDKPFVAINCSAIPETLLESELFGHAKGSFTGAVDKKIGLFEEAGDGILFLDEIGDLSLSLQAKLLRVLQEKKIKRVGDNNYIDISVRVLAATHKDLKKAVEDGSFREDLYFRLNVIPIVIPPLRERTEDILPLAQLFLRKFAKENGRALNFSKSAVDHMVNFPWQGNVRELENAIERAAVLATDNEITSSELPQLEETFTNRNSLDNLFQPLLARKDLPKLEDISNSYIQFVAKNMKSTKEHIANVLGIDRKTLYRRMQGSSDSSASSPSSDATM
jgi:DNA-binding NtrC family response regulator